MDSKNTYRYSSSASSRKLKKLKIKKQRGETPLSKIVIK